MKSLEDRLKWNRYVAKENDPLDFYDKHYAGLTRGKLIIQDRNLYNKLKNDGLLYAIPASKRRIKIEDPLAYYNKNYPGFTRKKLATANSSLYNKLKKEGLLHNIPVLKASARKKKYEKIEDPLAYYNQHYPGLTRGQLARKNSGLYEKLAREGLLKHIPTSYKVGRHFGKDLVAYYNKHYPGLTRAELCVKDSNLYSKLLQSNLLCTVPTVGIMQQDPLAYYHKHYPLGLTQRQLKNRNRQLYNALNDAGLLNNI